MTTAHPSDIQSTLDQRASSHGNFIVNGNIMQRLKNSVRATAGWEKLAPHQAEAIDMILHKIGRILSGNPNFADHWHDIAGYATLVEKELTSTKLSLKGTPTPPNQFVQQFQERLDKRTNPSI
jgi:hypothetical protein